MRRPAASRLQRNSRSVRHLGAITGGLALGLMLAVAAVPARAQSSSAQSVEARGFLDAGKDAFRAKDYSRAAGFFQKAFAKDPSLTIALYNQAFALKKANLLAQARDVYDAYTKIKPDDADGFYGLADVYRLLGNEAEAIQTFNLYLSKETRSGKDRYTTFARDYLAKAGAPAKAKDDAPKGFQAREAAKSADELYVAAGKQLREGKYSAAAASFATVYELDPRRHQALLKMGLALRKAKELPAAASAYKRYMLANPGDFDGLFGLAETKRQMNDVVEAADLFKKYVSREDRSSRKKYKTYAEQQLASLTAKIAAGETGKPKIAGARPVATETIDPKKAELLQEARALYRKKAYLEAASKYDAAWAIDKSDRKPLHKKALSLRKGREYVKSRVIYETLASQDRDDLDAVFGLAETLRLEGNVARSKKVFTTYLAKERREERASYITYAQKQLRAMNGEAPASPATERVATTSDAAKTQTAEPAKAKAAMAEGQRAYNAKDFAGAVAKFREAQGFDPDLDDAWLKEALALRKGGDFDAARKAYLAYQSRNPSDLDAVFGIAETDRLAGKSSSALMLFRKYIAEETRSNRVRYVQYAKDTVVTLSKTSGEDPKEAAAFVEKGNTHYRAKEFSKAANAFSKAREAQPSDANIAQRQALALRKAGRLDEAIAVYDELIAGDDTDLDSVFGRSESLRLRGDGKRALDGFRSYIDREQRSERARYVAYATEKRNELEAAIPDAAKASVAVAENDDANVDVTGPSVQTPSPSVASPSERHAAVLGRALAADELIVQARTAKDEENYDAARQYLALAIARSPKDADAYLLRGELYDVVGNVDAARENYLKVLELAAGTPTGDAAEKHLNGANPNSGPQIVRSARKARPLSAGQIAKVNAAIADGRSALDRGAANEAVAVLEEGVRTDKRNFEAWMLLGDAYLATKDDDAGARAVGAFQRAAFLAPKTAAPIWGLALAYDVQSMKEKATPLFARYSKSDASDVDAEKKERATLIARGVDTKRPWIRR